MTLELDSNKFDLKLNFKNWRQNCSWIKFLDLKLHLKKSFWNCIKWKDWNIIKNFFATKFESSKINSIKNEEYKCHENHLILNVIKNIFILEFDEKNWFIIDRILRSISCLVNNNLTISMSLFSIAIFNAVLFK